MKHKSDYSEVSWLLDFDLVDQENNYLLSLLTTEEKVVLMCTIALSDGPTKRKTIFGDNTNKKELSITIQNLSETLTYMKKKFKEENISTHNFVAETTIPFYNNNSKKWMIELENKIDIYLLRTVEPSFFENIERNLTNILKCINIKTDLITRPPNWSLNEAKIRIKHTSIVYIKDSLMNGSDIKGDIPMKLKERKLHIKVFELCKKFKKDQSISKSFSDKTNLHKNLPKLEDYDCFQNMKKRYFQKNLKVEESIFYQKNSNFDDDSEELNYAETTTIQLILIKQHFPSKVTNYKNGNRFRVIGSYKAYTRQTNIERDRMRNGGRCVFTSKSFPFSLYQIPNYINL